MRLSTKLVHICLDTLQPQITAVSDAYFKHSKGRFGYHASDLNKTHGLPRALANKMSALFNLWLNSLEANKDWLPIQLFDRLVRCTKSFSALAGRPSTCKSKLCPWCRAAKIMQVERLLALSGAQGYIKMDIPIVDVVKPPRTPAAALMSVKNVLLLPAGPILRVSHVYRECKPNMNQLDRGMVRSILFYDHFTWKTKETLYRWFTLTKDMNFFNRKSSPGNKCELLVGTA